MNGDDARKAKRQAKLLYLDGVAVGDIATRTQLDVDLLEFWIYKGTADDPRWKDEFDARTARMVDAVYDRSRRNIAKVWEIGVPLIFNSLASRARAGTPLSLKEAKAVTEILTSFDKLRRADAGAGVGGDGDDRPSFAPATIDELRDAVLKDEFLGLIPLQPGVDFVTRGDADAGTDAGRVPRSNPERHVEGGGVGDVPGGERPVDGEAGEAPRDGGGPARAVRGDGEALRDDDRGAGEVDPFTQ